MVKLDEEESNEFDELEELLIHELGINTLKAKIVVQLLRNERSTVRTLCNKLTLHQPQVSVMCNKMVEEGLLEVSFEKMTTGRGRKANVYRFAASGQATMNKLLSPVVDKLRRQEMAITKALLSARKKK